MIVNEEGLPLDLPLNPIASAMAKMPIVGNVVMLTNESVRKLK